VGTDNFQLQSITENNLLLFTAIIMNSLKIYCSCSHLNSEVMLHKDPRSSIFFSSSCFLAHKLNFNVL